MSYGNPLSRVSYLITIVLVDRMFLISGREKRGIVYVKIVLINVKD